jgi:hypothetical protein
MQKALEEDRLNFQEGRRIHEGTKRVETLRRFEQVQSSREIVLLCMERPMKGVKKSKTI